MSVGDVALWMAVGALAWPATAAALRARDTTAAVFAAAGAIAVALVAIAAWSPRTWHGLAQEDGLVEWATVFAFVGAAIWNAAQARRAVTGALGRALLVGLVLFCGFVAGEEISWGQRLFAFQPPEVFLAHNFQQELNVHNVLMDERALGFKVESKHIVATVAFVFGVVGPLLQRGLARRDVTWLAGIAPPALLAPLFLAVVATELSYPVDLAGEGAELMLGVLFFASALCAAPPRPAPATALLAAPLVLGIFTAPLLARLVFGADEPNVRAATAELTLLRDDVARGVTDKLRRKRGTVHKRVFTAARDGYLQLSGGAFLEGHATPADAPRRPGGPGGPKREARRDRRGYFLDPWNNPYWVRVDPARGLAAVYSFGPNRRRDTDTRRMARPGGDDIVVTIPVSPKALGDVARAPPAETAQDAMEPGEPGSADGE